MSSNLLGLLNNQSQDSRVFKNAELKTIDFEDIAFNPENHFPMSELMDLQTSIKEKGLLNPPVVYRSDDDGKYVLISGHRRLTAIEPLIDTGVMPPEIKCLVIPEPTDEISEIESIFLANRNRPPLSEGDLKICVNQLIDTWHKKPKEERKGRMRDYIASYLNISPRTLQKYINEYNQNEINQEQTDVLKTQHKSQKKVLNTLKKISVLPSQIEEAGVDLFDEHIIFNGKEVNLSDSLILLQKLSDEIIKLLDCTGD